MITGVQTISTFSSQQREARARQQQGTFEQQAYDRNAQLADLQAADAVRRGEITAQQRGREVRASIGDARASYAGQGVALDAGSPLDVQSDIASLGALDIATIRNNAAREAWGFSTQAADLRSRGILAKAGADMSALGLRADSINTLITGAGKTYGLYRQKMDNTGVKTSTARPAKIVPYKVGVDSIPAPSGRANG
jgi:hypothetical protein